MKLSLSFCSIFVAVFFISQATAIVREETQPLSVCGEGAVPLVCDKDLATAAQNKAVVKVKREAFEIKATIKCKGTAAAAACLDLDGPDGVVGIVIANDGGESMCGSTFVLGDQANEIKTVCEGEDFKIDQKVKIERL